MSETIVDRIKQLAMDHAMTINELERKIDVGQGTISRWNQRTPGIDKVEKVAKYFYVSVDYLLGLESYQDMKYKQAHKDFEDDFKSYYRMNIDDLTEEEQQIVIDQIAFAEKLAIKQVKSRRGE